MSESLLQNDISLDNLNKFETIQEVSDETSSKRGSEGSQESEGSDGGSENERRNGNSDDSDNKSNSSEISHECPICFYTLDSEGVAICPMCASTFHQECLAQWNINYKTGCPKCNFQDIAFTIKENQENCIVDNNYQSVDHNNVRTNSDGVVILQRTFFYSTLPLFCCSCIVIFIIIYTFYILN